MNLQDALVQVLQQATVGIQEGVSFLKAELPDVVEQLLVYNLVASVVYMVLCCATLVPVWLYFKAYLKAQPTEDATSRYRYIENWWFCSTGGRTDTSVSVLVLAGVLSTTLATGGVIFNLTDILKIALAPKVWLIEYAAALAK